MDTISSLPVIPKHQLRLNLPQRHESGPQIRYVPVGAFQHTPECASVTDDPIRLARSRDLQPGQRPLSEPSFTSGTNSASYGAFDLQTLIHNGSPHTPLKASQEPDHIIHEDQRAIDGLSSTCSPPALFHAQVPTLKQRLTDVNEPRRSQTFDVRKHAVNPVLFVRRWAQIRLPNDSPTAQITKKLRAARHRSYLRKYFVSEPDIRRIVSPEAVHQELARSNFSKLERIRKDPITIEDGGPYVKILAILYLIKKPTKIRLFVQSGVCDRDLPLEQDPRRDGPEGSYALRSRHNNQACTILFKRRDYAVDFLEHQWTVLAPTFVRNDAAVVPLVEIEPEVVLPFLSHQEVLKQGGSSKVFRTVIQPDHDLLGNTKPEVTNKLTWLVSKSNCNIYAIKALKSNNKKAFSREATILTKLSDYRHTHDHLITLLATYKHQGTYHLIFPWAEADLFDFWKERTHDTMGMDIWVIEQCRGLASGLNSVHRYATLSGSVLYSISDIPSRKTDGKQNCVGSIEDADPGRMRRNLFGRHGDLKPENILWYPDERSAGRHGILKITDFGVARFNTEDRWDTRRTGRMPNSATYRSPEMDLDCMLTSACDVWALGCVFLQFVTWYLGGYKLVEHFGQRRLANDLSMANIPTDTFFITYVESGVKQVKVKPAVIEVSLFSGLFVIDLPVILNRDMSTSDIDRAVCILITADQL
ncbi:unnamed protein product [Alternaria alternata]